jgi:hypothetical protein
MKRYRKYGGRPLSILKTIVMDEVIGQLHIPDAFTNWGG